MDEYNLKEFRKTNNLTQTELGKYLGFQKAFVSCIEHGKDKLLLRKYEKLLNNPFGWDISMLKAPSNKEVIKIESKEKDVVIVELRSQVERLESKIENLNREIGELKVLLRLSQSNKND